VSDDDPGRDLPPAVLAAIHQLAQTLLDAEHRTDPSIRAARGSVIERAICTFIDAQRRGYRTIIHEPDDA
jgi:hypothetical protein